MAPRGASFEQHCSACHDPAVRARWGCDAPAAEPVAWVDPCPVCGGENEQCAECEGTGRAPVWRCPNAIATPRERSVLQAALMVEHGVLPDPGGWLDQAHVFVQAYPIACAEIARWREKHHEEAMRRQKAKR